MSPCINLRGISKDMFLCSASGHAKVIAETLKENGIEIEGVYDDNTSLQSFCDYPFLGVLKTTFPDQTFIISIGDNRCRKDIASRLTVNWGKAVSKYAHISDSVMIGNGTVVMKGVSINADVRIGSHISMVRLRSPTLRQSSVTAAGSITIRY